MYTPISDHRLKLWISGSFDIFLLFWGLPVLYDVQVVDYSPQGGFTHPGGLDPLPAILVLGLAAGVGGRPDDAGDHTAQTTVTDTRAIQGSDSATFAMNEPGAGDALPHR